MNDRKDNNIPECLYPGDPRACMLLGAQKKPAEDKKIRRSCFVHVLYIKGQYLLFHTLTRKILLLELKYIDYFADDRLFPSSVLEEELPAKLYSDHFLVPEDEQESRTYLELKDILVLKEELPTCVRRRLSTIWQVRQILMMRILGGLSCMENTSETKTQRRLCL